MRNLKAIPLLVLTTFLLTACSFTMSGYITDRATDSPIQDATITIELSDKTRDAQTNEDGKYKIKKDDRDQTVTITAEGYEEFTTIIKKEKSKDFWLRPTPVETTRRIMDHFINSDLDPVYGYLHPHYQGIITKEVFKTELNNSFLKDFIPNMKEYRVEGERDLESWRDPAGQRTYYDVKEVSIIVVMDVEGEYELEMTFHYVLEGEYWRWLFDRTTTSPS